MKPVNTYNVSCVCNSSYSFSSIVLKLYRWFGHGLKMYIYVEYYPKIILFLI